MRTAKQISEDIATVQDELEAIVSVATKEERELSDEEQTRVDAITNDQLPKLQGALERRQKIDSEIKALAAKRLTPEIDRQEIEASGAIPASKLSSVKVPATAKGGRNLVAFKGEDADRQAYVAGHVILGGIFGREKSVEFCRDMGLVKATMGGQTDGLKGGFLVPDEMANALIRLRDSRGVFPRFARSIPMGSDVIHVPRMITDVTAYWVGEGDEITASDAEVGSAKLVADKLAALTKVSTELDEGAVVDVGDMVVTSMAYAAADKIDNAGFNGDGTSTYGGVKGLSSALNSSAVQDAISGNVSAATLDLADFEKTVGLLPEYEGSNNRWFINKTAFWNSARRLMDAAGGNTISDLGSTSEMVFLGYPVTFTQVMSTGTAVSTIVAYFGDLGLSSTMGTRRGVRISVSEDRYFENDLIGIKSTQRVAINNHETGDTVRTRPVVALKTAAS